METPDISVRNRPQLGRSSSHPAWLSQKPDLHKMEHIPAASAPVHEKHLNLSALFH
jgi:hypothetical protein